MSRLAPGPCMPPPPPPSLTSLPTERYDKRREVSRRHVNKAHAVGDGGRHPRLRMFHLGRAKARHEQQHGVHSCSETYRPKASISRSWRKRSLPRGSSGEGDRSLYIVSVATRRVRLGAAFHLGNRNTPKLKPGCSKARVSARSPPRRPLYTQGRGLAGWRPCTGYIRPTAPHLLVCVKVEWTQSGTAGRHLSALFAPEHGCAPRRRRLT